MLNSCIVCYNKFDEKIHKKKMLKCTNCKRHSGHWRCIICPDVVVFCKKCPGYKLCPGGCGKYKKLPFKCKGCSKRVCYRCKSKMKSGYCNLCSMKWRKICKYCQTRYPPESETIQKLSVKIWRFWKRIYILSWFFTADLIQTYEICSTIKLEMTSYTYV